jgi:5-hydroxyisourate hydrolase-like protein (transthyretin family)
MIGCLCTALASAAAAQTAPKPIPRAQYQQVIDGHFNGADTDHDGMLTRDELNAQRQRELAQTKATVAKNLQDAFKRLDTNKDGRLTLEEFMATAPTIKTTETAEQMVQRLDTNHDGKVSAEEFRAPEMAKFNRVDANHDGIVTPAEVQAARGK